VGQGEHLLQTRVHVLDTPDIKHRAIHLST
jgi:hypothetical protein